MLKSGCLEKFVPVPMLDIKIILCLTKAHGNVCQLAFACSILLGTVLAGRDQERDAFSMQGKPWPYDFGCAQVLCETHCLLIVRFSCILFFLVFVFLQL